MESLGRSGKRRTLGMAGVKLSETLLSLFEEGFEQLFRLGVTLSTLREENFCVTYVQNPSQHSYDLCVKFNDASCYSNNLHAQGDVKGTKYVLYT